MYSLQVLKSLWLVLEALTQNLPSRTIKKSLEPENQYLYPYVVCSTQNRSH